MPGIDNISIQESVNAVWKVGDSLQDLLREIVEGNSKVSFKVSRFSFLITFCPNAGGLKEDTYQGHYFGKKPSICLRIKVVFGAHK